MKTKKRILFYAFALIGATLILFSSCKENKDEEINSHSQLMTDVAKPGILPVNAPKYSDVVMRSLTFRNESFEHGSTMQNVLDFHVTRLDWVYVSANDESYVNSLTAKGIKVGTTINASPGDSSFSIRDKNGKAQEVPWLPGRYFLCVNNLSFSI